MDNKTFEKLVLAALSDKIKKKDVSGHVKELTNVIEKIDLMKKAILARAFRGELGTNDPEEESAIEMLREALIQEGAEL